MAAHSGGRMSAHPSGESGWDDPAQILELLPMAGMTSSWTSTARHWTQLAMSGSGGTGPNS